MNTLDGSLALRSNIQHAFCVVFVAIIDVRSFALCAAVTYVIKNGGREGVCAQVRVQITQDVSPFLSALSFLPGLNWESMTLNL